MDLRSASFASLRATCCQAASASSRTAASGAAAPATAEITAKPAAPAARTSATRREIDPADRHDGPRRRARHRVGERGEPARAPRLLLRSGPEHGPERDVVDGSSHARATCSGVCVERPIAIRSRHVGRNPRGRQVVLAQVHGVGPAREREIDAVVHAEQRAGAARGRADRLAPRERGAVGGELRAQLHDRGAARARGERLIDRVARPARIVVGDDVQTSPAGEGVHSRPGSSIARSTIFLRSVLRLMPSSAAARIWLPSVRASAASISGRSTRSIMRW